MIVSNSNKTRCHHVIPSQNDVTEIAEERMVLMRGKSSPSTLFTTVKLSSDQVIDPNLSQLYPSPDLIEADIGIFRELFDMSFLSCSFTYVCYFFCPQNERDAFERIPIFMSSRTVHFELSRT